MGVCGCGLFWEPRISGFPDHRHPLPSLFPLSAGGRTFVRSASSGQKAGGGDPDSRLPEIVVILDFRMNAVHMVFILNMIFIENPLLVKTVFFFAFFESFVCIQDFAVI